MRELTTIEQPAAAPDNINLRAWFVFFALWMVGLAFAARAGLAAADATGSSLGLGIWLLAFYAFYLSLCCTVFPFPTTWIVLLVASNEFAGMVGIHGHPFERLIVVSTIGALATGMANLNEYHLFTFLLRFGRVARIRDTRLYHTAARWFSVNPFWVIALFSFIPIPVDIIRWLAITYRYPRTRYFWAYFLGRWFRYAAWCAASIGLNLTTRQILYIQLGLVSLILLKIVPKLLRQFRGEPRGTGFQSCGTGFQPVSDTRSSSNGFQPVSPSAVAPAIVGPPSPPYNPPDVRRN